MYHVVVGIDESEERATACAREVVRLPGESDEKRVTALHARTGDDDAPAGPATEVASVRAVVDRFEDAGIDCEVREAADDPAAAILGTAADVDAGLIVVAGRKRTPAGKALFGSVTQTVILDAERAVLVAPTGPDDA